MSALSYITPMPTQLHAALLHPRRNLLLVVAAPDGASDGLVQLPAASLTPAHWHADHGPLAEALGGDPSAAGRVTLIDAADPAAPKTLASLDTEWRAWGVALDASGRAFVAATDAGLLALAAEIPDGRWRLLLPWLQR